MLTVSLICGGAKLFTLTYIFIPLYRLLEANASPSLQMVRATKLNGLFLMLPSNKWQNSKTQALCISNTLIHFVLHNRDKDMLEELFVILLGWGGGRIQNFLVYFARNDVRDNMEPIIKIYTPGEFLDTNSKRRVETSLFHYYCEIVKWN